MSFIVKFKNRNIEPPAKAVNCSNKVIQIYDLQYNDKHIVEVVKTGEVNFYEKIQTYANDNDFSRLLKNIALTNNINLYATNQTCDVDLTNVPTNMTEMLIKAKEAEIITNKLSNDEYVKSKGIPFSEFIKNYSEKEHYEFLKSKYEKVGE